jgi:transmembrane sensor
MMMQERDIEIIERAVAWQQAVAVDAVDWTALTEWLEADPRHRDAFDDVALIDASVNAHRDDLRALLRHEVVRDANETAVPPPASTSRRWVLGAGIAAALALAAALPLIQSQQPQSVAYATAPGATRSVAFDDGSRLDLSADTAVRIGPHQQRVTLARGAVYFDVRHDPSRRLVVEAGGYRITDIGTRFSVDLAGDRVSIAVAQGSVTVTPPRGDPLRLDAGGGVIGTGSGPPIRASVIPAAVGSWRQGRLTYDNASLAKVASDISRYTGDRIEVATPLGDRRFSGVLVIGDGSHLVSDFAAVAGLAVHRGASRIVLSPGAG